MNSLGTLAQALQEVLGPVADDLGRRTGFIRRQRKLTGSRFVRLLVAGWLSQPDNSLSALCRIGVLGQVRLSAQALARRFTARAAALLEAVLAQAATRVVTAAAPVSLELVNRFTAVWLVDATTLDLPAAFAPQWPASGGGARAAMKAEVGLELKQGQLQGPYVFPGRRHEQQGRLAQPVWAPGSLRIADLGYYALERLSELDAAQVYWLSRLRLDTVVCAADGTALDLPAYARGLAAEGVDEVDRAVRLGARGQCPARLLMQRAPEAVAARRRQRLRESVRNSHGREPSQRSLALCDWTWLITNVPAAQLSLAEALALYGARWQVELLFKHWKQHVGVGQSRSRQPERILCEVYAKLLIAVLQHWLLLGGWSRPDFSRVKAAQSVRLLAPLVIFAPNEVALRDALARLTESLQHECHQNRRRREPSTWQTLTAGAPAWALS